LVTGRSPRRNSARKYELGGQRRRLVRSQVCLEASRRTVLRAG